VIDDTSEGLFTYKPALLAAPISYEVTGTSIAQYDNSGDLEWQVSFDDVTELAFVEHIIRGMRMRRLDIITTDGTHSIALNIAKGVGPDDSERAALRKIHSAVATALSETRPNLMVKIGEYGRAKFWFFVVGLLALIGAVGLLVAALMTGVSGDKLAGAVVPIGFLVVFGGFIAARYNTWQKTPGIPISTLAVVFEHLDAVEES